MRQTLFYVIKTTQYTLYMLYIKSWKFTDFWRSDGVCSLDDGLFSFFFFTKTVYCGIHYIWFLPYFTYPTVQYVKYITFCWINCIYFSNYSLKLLCLISDCTYFTNVSRVHGSGSSILFFISSCDIFNNTDFCPPLSKKK